MAFSLGDPLPNVLRAYVRRVDLGDESIDGRVGVTLDTAALIKDLDQAQHRNVMRFSIVFGFLAVGLLTSIGLSIWPPSGVKPPYMVAGSGIYSASVGTMLLAIARSWWRTDTILTVSKYASPQSLELVLRDLIAQEGRARSKGSSSTRAPARASRRSHATRQG